MHNTWLIIQREYIERIRTKAFIIMTLLMPVFMASTILVPVFLGDMNMWGWTIDAMTPSGWHRAIRGKTWPAHHPRHQIDHILVTPSVQVAEADVQPETGSDHRPIRARLIVT